MRRSVNGVVPSALPPRDPCHDSAPEGLVCL